MSYTSSRYYLHPKIPQFLPPTPQNEGRIFQCQARESDNGLDHTSLSVLTQHQYDTEEFDAVNEAAGNPLDIDYFTATLDSSTVSLANNHRAVCVFVNDILDEDVRGPNSYN